MYLLQLNDMRSAQSEMLAPVARAESRKALLDFMNTEKTDTYTDGQWSKVFKKNGPLEWYNPAIGHHNILNIGTLEERKAMVIKGVESQWNDLMKLPEKE